ncbi:MAG: dipeptide epimerase [Actinomycetota bacterium]|nr:dipeptide epimerase [Actinomycetota bacterium]
MRTVNWELEAYAADLELVEPFTIARRSWDVATSVFVKVSHSGHTGIGECSPEGPPEEIVDRLEKLDLEKLDGPFDLEGVFTLLDAGPARSALDIALHDLAAKSAGVSVRELLGLSGRPLPQTSVTLAITEPSRTVSKAKDLSEHPILKVKVGFEGDVDMMEEVRSVYSGRIRIDANEGWSEAEATTRLKALERFDIELCEQPIPSGDFAALSRVTSATSIPVYADEDVRTAADVVALAGSVDGVNLKLRKTGGIREAVRAAAVARALSLGVMVGCDLTSGVAATAEASVAALADFVDIDGPLLLRYDPWPGVSYDKGMLFLPSGPGLGVTRRA